jgi:hypothetical protein
MEPCDRELTNNYAPYDQVVHPLSCIRVGRDLGSTDNLSILKGPVNPVFERTKAQHGVNDARTQCKWREASYTKLTESSSLSFTNTPSILRKIYG